MFRTAPRIIARSSALRAVSRAPAPARRFISTAPPMQKSRSWKSLAGRIGITGAIIYYYNTTDVFAEEPKYSVQSLPETEDETETLPTIDALAKEREQRRKQAAAAEKEAAAQSQARQTATAGGVEGLEEEADQQGAFNPETGEINWDCPCLGGMAHGPCGEEFKGAFSCFVYSTEEPKGMDCIEKFQGMQNCFREYPEIYGAELESDEEDDVTGDQAHAVTESDLTESNATAVAETAAPTSSSKPKIGETSKESPEERAKAATEVVPKKYVPQNKSDDIISKAAHDETAANEAK